MGKLLAETRKANRISHRVSFAVLALGVLLASGMDAAFAVSPPAENASALVLHSTLAAVTGKNSGIAAEVADVRAGDTFRIMGDCVQRASTEQVRVVLTLADTLGDGSSGYHSVIPTDQEIQGDVLRVRVPDMPEVANHTFAVRLFLLGQDGPQICTAGAIRVAPVGKVG
jgi:hypothetical protein